MFNLLKHKADFLDTILDYLYPNFCLHCNTALYEQEENLCFVCLSDLERTYYERMSTNPIHQIFSHFEIVKRAVPCYFFIKDGVLQSLIHQIKYRKNAKVGEWLGQKLAEDLSEFITACDVVCAIPIHKKKLKKRGYNQSELISATISKHLNLPDYSQYVMKTINNDSQTQKNRLERVQNVKNVFEVINSAQFENKHVLIIDDIVTTGATMTSFLTGFELIPNCTVSILFLASQPLI